jgi:hypothetical protein
MSSGIPWDDLAGPAVLGLVFIGQAVAKWVQIRRERQRAEELRPEPEPRWMGDRSAAGSAPEVRPPPMVRSQSPPMPGRAKSPEEELREFLEALGMPSSAPAPPPLVPPPLPEPAPLVRRREVPPPPPVPVLLEPDEEVIESGTLLTKRTEDEFFATRTQATKSGMSGMEAADRFMSGEADSITRSTAAATVTTDGPESPWLAMLREPGGARRAFVMAEVLGRPRGA